jgi:hypothetical protein
MRKALLEDDAFLKSVLKGGSSKDLYETYTKRVRDSINEKTRQQESAPAVAPAENETYTLSKKDLDYYKKTQKEIATLYKSNGKYQSDYMKNLSGALSTVIRNAKTEGEGREIKISKQDMDALMKHARIYYKERQGMIFNPLTDRGKARLQVVEGMIRRNDKILKENKNPGRGPGMQA